MNAQPTRRRFGHGVARLPVGAPHASAAMALAAQRSVRGESLAVAAPLLTASMVLLALGLFPRFDSMATVPSELALRSETWIELQASPVPESVEPTPIAEPVVATTQEAPPPEPAISHPSDDANDVTQEGVTQKTRPALDLRSLLATTAPEIPVLQTDQPAAAPHARTPNRRPGGLPTARSLTDLPLAMARSTSAPSTPSARSAPSRNDVGRAVAATTDERRSMLGGEATNSAAMPKWQVEAERLAFLEAASREAASERGSGRVSTALPRVSARAEIDDEIAIRSAWAAEGWHEVPLDALPDCAPAGRQDALKRRIVAAAPSGSECRGDEGSFRFLETRNLNAFLMWSQTHPAGSASTRREEDVCDVLERALRCLAIPSTKELDPR